MRTPFSFLYDVERKVTDLFPENPFAPRAAFLVSFLTIIIFWFAVDLALRLLIPASSISPWLAANWGWLVIATAIIQVIYSFGRLVLEAKTDTTGTESVDRG